MSALHVARLAPGERVPSVRRMAQLTGLDRKTVHRAYGRLVTEGLLVTRPGSGTFLAPDTGGSAGPEPTHLVHAAERFRADARDLGLDPAVYARFLDRMSEPQLRRVHLAVVECNGEQLGLIAREVAEVAGAIVRRVALQELPARAKELGSTVAAVVTTECHREEVLRSVAPHGLPVFRVALDVGHAEHLLRHARRGHLVVVVRDLRYEPAFHRLMTQLQVPEPVRARVRMIEPRDLERTFRQLDPPATLYVSPLLGPDVPRQIPPGWRRITAHRYIDPGSLELLTAQIALLDARRIEQPAASVALGPISLSS